MMTTEIDELRRYLKIDKNRLDEELEEQPMLLFKISEAYTEAAAERDAAKEMLTTTDANLDKKGRVELDRAEEKVTEPMVKTYVQTHKDHAAATAVYLKAKHRANQLESLKESFQSRGYMIRDLCTLYAANYYERDSARPTNAGNRTTYSMARQKRERQRLHDE